MRATIDLPDAVFEALRERANGMGTTPEDLIVQAIQVQLDSSTPQLRTRISLPLIPSTRSSVLKSLTNTEIDAVLDRSVGL